MTKHTSILYQNQVFSWIALGTGGLLLIPLLAMQFSSGVNWDLADFIVMGVLLFGTGSLFVFLTRMINKQFHLFTGIVLLLAFLWLWAELSVGVFTSWGN